MAMACSVAGEKPVAGEDAEGGCWRVARSAGSDEAVEVERFFL